MVAELQLRSFNLSGTVVGRKNLEWSDNTQEFTASRNSRWDVFKKHAKEMIARRMKFEPKVLVFVKLSDLKANSLDRSVA